jgi:hypothetical protein
VDAIFALVTLRSLSDRHAAGFVFISHGLLSGDFLYLAQPWLPGKRASNAGCFSRHRPRRRRPRRSG